MKKWIFVLVVTTMPQYCSAMITFADSLSDWSVTGTQGENGWMYGYYNLTADADATYQTTDFIPYLNDGTEVISPTNQWDGSMWRMSATPPPLSYMGPGDVHPDGTNTGSEERWPIRRWISDISGPVTVTSYLKAVDTSGTGASSLLFINGSFWGGIISNSPGGVSLSSTTTLSIGDVLDLALTPEDRYGSRDDTSDASYNRLTITTSPVVPAPGAILLGSIGVSIVGYLRRRRTI